MRIRDLSWLALAAAAGCSGPPIPSLNFTVANPFANNNGALSCPQDQAALGADVATMRITVRAHSDDPSKRQLVCDSVFPKTSPATLALPAGKKYDVFAEAFDMNGQRKATGVAYNADPGSPPTMRLFLPETFHCNPNGDLKQGRAFHTATTLPNGQILIAGGLIPTLDGSEGPAPSMPLDGLYVDGSVEIYDPATESFSFFPSQITPRAFHQAVLLPDKGDGTFSILFVGGIATTAAAAQQPVVQNSPSRFRLAFVDPTSVTGAPAEILTWDPVAKTLTKSALPKVPTEFFQGVGALPGGGAVIAGGETLAMDGTPMFDINAYAMTDGSSLAMGMLTDGRVAPGVAVTDASNALVIGGATDAQAMPAQQPILKLSVAGATISATPAALSFPTFPLLQFPTITTLDTGRFLVSGGFVVGTQIDSTSASNPPPDNGGLYLLTNGAAAAVTVSPANPPPAPPGMMMPKTFDPDCLAAERFRPAGWNAATLLPSGDRVLVTGGTGRTDNACGDCDKDATAQCVLDQTAIIDVTHVDDPTPSVTLGMRPNYKMTIKRFGHTQSVLPDGRVLILGGLTRQNVATPVMPVFQTFAPKRVELFSPVRQTPPTPINNGNQMLDPDDPVLADLKANGMLSRRAVTMTDGRVDATSQFYNARDPMPTAVLNCGGLQ